LRYKSERRYDTLAGLEKGENQMAKKDDALLKIPSEVPSGKDVPFVDITVMSFSEAQATDDIKLGEHVVALGNEFIKRAGSAIKFVQIHRSAIQELRKRYSKQGRRNPVPGSPSWGEFCAKVFHVSQQYMNSILASAYPKKLVAKKKPAKKDAVVSTSITDIPTDDPMPETAAQAVAVVATKLAKEVASGHGNGKAAKAWAREIVEVDKDEPFLPTVANVKSSLLSINRAFGEMLESIKPEGRQGVVTMFVNALSEDEFVMLHNSVDRRDERRKKEKEQAKKAAENWEKEKARNLDLPLAKAALVAMDSAIEVGKDKDGSLLSMSPEEFQQHIIDSVNNHPDIPDETKAAAVEKMREDLAEMDDKEAAAA
jgi:hypothetical protein